MFRAIITMWWIALGTKAAWHQTEVRGLDLFELSEKSFSLEYCGERSHSSTSYLAPQPTCNDIVPEDRKVALIVTFWRRMITAKPFQAMICRAAKVTTKTWVNFFSERKVEQSRKWIAADLGICRDIIEGKRNPAEDQQFPGAVQYGQIKTKYTYLKNREIDSKVNVIMNTTARLDENLGSIFGLDDKRHNCQYKDGYCNLGVGGILIWSPEKAIIEEQECPFLAKFT